MTSEEAFEANRLYAFAQQVKASLEIHQWCRQQRKYDAEFVANLHKDLGTICNRLYDLTQLSSE